MKIYKVSYDGDPDGQKGFEFVASMELARKLARAWEKQEKSPGIGDHRGEIELLEISPTKRGILKALNKHGSHPDNG